MKALFLDIDGVIATEEQYSRRRDKFWKKTEWAKELGVPYPFDEKCVEILNEIVEETDAEIIISSDWRLHWDLILLSEIFKHSGVKKLPRSVTKVKPVSMGQLSKNRANEILDFVNHFDLKQFAILDDLDLMQFLDKGDAKERFVRTKDNQGLKEVGVKEKVINILNR
jgi:hypothetical protein